jgi:hypothetical protein
MHKQLDGSIVLILSHTVMTDFKEPCERYFCSLGPYCKGSCAKSHRLRDFLLFEINMYIADCDKQARDHKNCADDCVVCLNIFPLSLRYTDNGEHKVCTLVGIKQEEVARCHLESFHQFKTEVDALCHTEFNDGWRLLPDDLQDFEPLVNEDNGIFTPKIWQLTFDHFGNVVTRTCTVNYSLQLTYVPTPMYEMETFEEALTELADTATCARELQKSEDHDVAGQLDLLRRTMEQQRNTLMELSVGPPTKPIEAFIDPLAYANFKALIGA